MTALATVKGGLFAQYGDTHQLIGGKRVIHRTLAASPVAAATPNFIGERVFDQASNQIWQAVGLTNVDWVGVQLEVGKTSPELI